MKVSLATSVSQKSEYIIRNEKQPKYSLISNPSVFAAVGWTTGMATVLLKNPTPTIPKGLLLGNPAQPWAILEKKMGNYTKIESSSLSL